jgi:hypothetical protein
MQKITLHYFEKFFEPGMQQPKLRRCTYNTFDLTEDFLNMLEKCGLVIPSEKTKLTRKIKKFKDNAVKKDEHVSILSDET